VRRVMQQRAEEQVKALEAAQASAPQSGQAAA
jgi:hypothetical protein